MVRCKIRYEGALRCELEHEKSGVRVNTDAPVDNHGKGESFSPTDLMSVATAACMTTIMGIYAQEHHLDIHGLWAETTKEMSANPRRIARITVEMHVPLPATSPHVPALQECARSSPAMRSLNPDIEVPLIWHWEG